MIFEESKLKMITYIVVATVRLTKPLYDMIYIKILSWDNLTCLTYFDNCYNFVFISLLIWGIVETSKIHMNRDNMKEIHEAWF